MTRENADIQSPPLDFLRSKYGDEFEGHISLWSRQTRQTLFFSCREWDELERAIGDRVDHHDLYVALGTQREKLPAGKRGSTAGVLSVPSFVADIRLRGKQTFRKTVSTE